jgi:hypothetical protein
MTPSDDKIYLETLEDELYLRIQFEIPTVRDDLNRKTASSKDTLHGKWPSSDKHFHLKTANIRRLPQSEDDIHRKTIFIRRQPPSEATLKIILVDYDYGASPTSHAYSIITPIYHRV